MCRAEAAEKFLGTQVVLGASHLAPERMICADPSSLAGAATAAPGRRSDFLLKRWRMLRGNRRQGQQAVSEYAIQCIDMRREKYSFRQMSKCHCGGEQACRAPHWPVADLNLTTSQRVSARGLSPRCPAPWPTPGPRWCSARPLVPCARRGRGGESHRSPAVHPGHRPPARPAAAGHARRSGRFHNPCRSDGAGRPNAI